MTRTNEPLNDPSAKSDAGDIVLLPVAVAAFWTTAYQIVLITRWPAHTILWCFLIIAVSGSFLIRRLLSKSNAPSAYRYRFHSAHLVLLFLGVGCAATTLFVRRPNQDDVVYFHRALTQLAALSQPIILDQTSVDMHAAAFSPLHLATSYEMLVALIGHWLRIDPLYLYQVIAPALTVFLIPFVLYWCARTLGLARWPAAIGAVLAVLFLLVDATGPAGFGTTVFGRMWQGKAIVWILFLPVGLCLSYRYLRRGSHADLLWLTLLMIAGVGLSNTALYLLPVVVGCCCISFFAIELFSNIRKPTIREQLRRYLLLIIPLIYPVALLALLKLDVILQPIDKSAFGPEFIPWQPALDNVLGLLPDYSRDFVIMVAVPLLIVRGKRGLFLFFYLCAVWLVCLNPLLAHVWMRNIIAVCYFRLVYLLQLPLLCAMAGASVTRFAEWPRSSVTSRIAIATACGALVLSVVNSYWALSIMPRNPKAGIGWKTPGDYQLLAANVEFANTAGRYMSHSKLLAPAWTASCELPLLLPTMKVTAPRFVIHYFANVGNREEGILRSQAQAFIEGGKSSNPKQLERLETSFRQVIQSGRANAVAVSESESDRVLAALQSVNPAWYRVLEAGGLVLMMPDGTASENLE